jgi:hypothetical protein
MYIRRLALVVAIVVLGVRNYGNFHLRRGVTQWRRGSFLTEFGRTSRRVRGLWAGETARNTLRSDRTEATRSGRQGSEPVSRGKIAPDEQLIASTDFKSRPGQPWNFEVPDVSVNRDHQTFPVGLLRATVRSSVMKQAAKRRDRPGDDPDLILPKQTHGSRRIVRRTPISIVGAIFELQQKAGVWRPSTVTSFF